MPEAAFCERLTSHYSLPPACVATKPSRPRGHPVRLRSVANLNPQKPARVLSIRILRTEHERLAIEELRLYAPLEAEKDLDAGAAEADAAKDAIGIVMAIYSGRQVVATVRGVPCGHGLTLAEKSWRDSTADKEVFGVDSWEVGRLIVAPDHRRADLLPQYLTLALGEMIRMSEAKYFHASCSPLMARLYRRFGYKTEKVVQGDNGLSHALIYAHVADVAAALMAKRDMGVGTSTVLRRGVLMSSIHN